MVNNNNPNWVKSIGRLSPHLLNPNRNNANDPPFLRQSTEPMFNISGDLNPHQIGLVKRAWKLTLKEANGDETEIAVRFSG